MNDMRMETYINHHICWQLSRLQKDELKAMITPLKKGPDSDKIVFCDPNYHVSFNADCFVLSKCQDNPSGEAIRKHWLTIFPAYIKCAVLSLTNKHGLYGCDCWDTVEYYNRVYAKINNMSDDICVSLHDHMCRAISPTMIVCYILDGYINSKTLQEIEAQERPYEELYNILFN